MARVARLALLVLCLCTSLGSEAAENGFVVATSASSSAAGVHGELLRRMLTGQVDRWPDGAPVRIVLLPKGSPPMVWLCEQVLNVSERSYRRFLLEKAFRGELQKPVEASDQSDAASRVAGMKGTLAPLPASFVKGAVRKLNTD